MLKFGGTNMCRFGTIQEIIRVIICANSINYSLLMPVILFLHSISSPVEIVTTLADEFRNETTENIKMNCLIILICWLRESSSHHDFMSTETRTPLQEFLSEIISSECINPQLSAAARKAQSQLTIIVDEQLDLSTCLDIYSAEIKPLLSPVPRSKRKENPPHTMSIIMRDTHSVDNAISSPAVTCGDSPVDQQQPFTNSSTPCSSEDHYSSNGHHSVASHHFPDLDITGRPKQVTSLDPEDKSTATTKSNDFTKKTRRTESDIRYELEGEFSTLKKYKSPMELAMHMTLLELHCGMLSLRPREFTSLRWTQATLKQQHPDIGGCLHLYRYIHDTNQRILWIAREVLIHGRDVSSLSQSLSFFIQVAEFSYQLNNFNTVFQVVEALKLPAIKRVSAWKSLPEPNMVTFEALCVFCDTSLNFINYRQHLRSLGSQARIPCLPVLLKDISFLEMSHPWTVLVDGGNDDKKSCNLIDIQKMDSLFRLLCREVFSLRSPYITSFYTSRLLCSVQLQECELIPDQSVNWSRDRRGRNSRIDSRIDVSPGANNASSTPLFNGKVALHSEIKDSYVGGYRAREDSEDGDNDSLEDSMHNKYVMICMSLSNGAMDENFFDNCCLDNNQFEMENLSPLFPMPISQFLTVASYLPVPLFSLKMKKQMQGQDKLLDMKIQQQMTCDIRTAVTNLHFVSNITSSPQKNKLDNLEYPEPLATIPHNMSIVSQDAVQSYAQCIDEQLFIPNTSLDIGVPSIPDSRDGGGGKRDKRVSPKKKNSSFSFFGSNCGNDGVTQLQGNRETNMMLTAYDRKTLSLYREIASINVDLTRLWEWSKVINDDEKSRLLGGLVNAGLA